ncbi:putative metallo-beta-lactamase domain protein [Cladophialophora carrionii]|uniref:Putative metallo-beta-lactamase domain protein n=1 Tax=Cladophialophora carrionii TaxID=86049 RepID=A0A1C1CB94_9EURO|nr:putative metallo-beta-lactamase domain protein [Cladophialophora carrionii]
MKTSLLSLAVLACAFPAPTPAEFVTSAQGLRADVYHLPPAPVVYQNSTALTFSPTAFTLIQGSRDAVLVDAPATDAQAGNLTAWIKSTLGPRKSLKYIYITHGHGDHFFTAPMICAAFPGCRVVARADVNAHMLEQYEDVLFTGFWLSLFPGGQITSTPFNASYILPRGDADGTFMLEGHAVRAVEVGQGDTYNSTVLHVPDLQLVVGGDVIYGKCHQLTVEDSTPELRRQWIRSLDRAAALNPSFVVPSHTRPGDGFAPSHIRDTKVYIRTWEKVMAQSKTWEELEAGMKKAFPLRDGSFILRWSSQAPFGASSFVA